MNVNYRLAVTAVMVAALAGCSGSAERRRQANQDFNYLETAPLSSWNSPSGSAATLSNEYAIPSKEYPGAIGRAVDIRPPQQVLALIPGARTVHNSDGTVSLQLVNSAELDELWTLTKRMATERNIALDVNTARTLETGWVNWNNEDEDTEISSRYRISRASANDQNLYTIKLLDWREAGVEKPVSMVNQERYSILMTNLVMAKYDAYEREKARLRAEELVKQIPITMGQDRSGLPVIIARAPYNVFWERLPSLLQTLGFTVDGRNRSQGTIDVSFRNPDDSFWVDLGIQPLQLENREYKLQLGDLGNRTSITVTDEDGKPITDEALESIAPVLAAVIDKDNQK
ncbi:outer membrane protein assembly factor BamC [Photobacterium sp. WH77]|uniref:outer membrane protein assembly factor BamC n=1 Tax=unclassified Photobacterium TaxID=2628852 RepID=UPI001EDA05EF|nr:MULTISPECIES: outer membrane protein assembly factor BamC [unclassified Photobacterium]MCG2836783.1 outer membrane protein assembly factor BamC [Photobacterium sp. WH77]MCG2844608.1 outer membrane protein assembly factor BamC [Photobacterium sp. WH80]